MRQTFTRTYGKTFEQRSYQLSKFRTACPHPSPCWCKECKTAYQRAYAQRPVTELPPSLRFRCNRCGIESPGSKRQQTCKPCRIDIRAEQARSIEIRLEVDRLERLAKPSAQTQRKCVDCGVTVSKSSAIRCLGCYRTSVAKKESARKRPYRPRKNRGICRQCGSNCTKFVCNECVKQNKKLSRKSAKRRRRALMAGVASESYNIAEIGRRDKWQCGLCGLRVNRLLKYPNPKSPSIDHIVPISLGGHDVRSNVQIAHNDCNRIKGVNVNGVGEQLRLLG